MKRVLSCVAVLGFFIGLSGCVGLGKMQVVEYTEKVKPNTAKVNIVRRAVFMGDGGKVEMWDGDTFIGTLAAGTMLQIDTTPGEHTFMAYAQGSWGIAKGNFEAGKSYFLKYNQGFGFIALGAAKADDPRIVVWEKMKVVALDESASKPVPQRYVDGARTVLAKVEAGKAKVTVVDESNAR